MPLGLNPLSQGQVEFIKRWINAGAPNEGNVADETLLNDTTPLEEAFEPLPAPAAGAGIQVVIPEFEVAPNFEREFFLYKKLGNTEDLYVNRIEIKMRNNSHHFILYDFTNQLPPNLKPELNMIRDIRNANGSNNLKNMLAMPYHVYIAGAQTSYSDFKLPEGVVISIPANTAMDLNSHYVNKLASSIKGEVYMNLFSTPYTSGMKIAKPLNLNNRLLYLPPGQRTTAVENFTFDSSVKIISLTSHTHQLGEKFVIKIKGGARHGEIVYTSTDWHHPAIVRFDPPLVINAGEGLTSEITYNNIKTTPVFFGLTSEDEMGIIFGYYYEN
jgi:Copper type II ascorbate-dependent monooxygenase, C-terminal domain.